MTPVPTLPRELLAQALGNPRLVAAFEQQSEAVSQTQRQAGENAQATTALQDATFLVLSPNATLTGERVFRPGSGIETKDQNGVFTVSVSDEVAHVDGGFSVRLVAQSDATLLLPPSGTLATRSGEETLQNKTLYAPRVEAVRDFSDDTAAAAGGVLVGGIYRTGSALKMRVA